MFDEEVPADIRADALEQDQVEAHFGTLQELLASAYENKDFVTVRLARSYDRKGYESFDQVPGRRNEAYGRPNDDYVVSIAFRVACQRPADFHKLENIDRAVSGDKAAAELAKLDAELARADAERQRIEAKRNALKASMAPKVEVISRQAWNKMSEDRARATASQLNDSLTPETAAGILGAYDNGAKSNHKKVLREGLQSLLAIINADQFAARRQYSANVLELAQRIDYLYRPEITSRRA